MYVVKRDGRREQVQFDKITARVKKLCYGLHENVDPVSVAMRVIEGVYDGVTTCLLYTSPSPRDLSTSRMPSSA